jgi:4-aminobutyrate aminotransferase-like enzyme
MTEIELSVQYRPRQLDGWLTDSMFDFVRSRESRARTYADTGNLRAKRQVSGLMPDVHFLPHPYTGGRHAAVIRLLPPLTVSSAEIDRMATALEMALVDCS